MAFGVAIPSPAQLLPVEEVSKPGAGVQAVPAGQDVHAQPPRPGPSMMSRPHVSASAATPQSMLLHHHLLYAYCLACSVSGQDGEQDRHTPSSQPLRGKVKNSKGDFWRARGLFGERDRGVRKLN